MSEERKHSKFSASASVRWFNCSGSVALSEGLPDTTSPAADEGIRAHKIYEKLLLRELFAREVMGADALMLEYVRGAANHTLEIFKKAHEAVLLVEQRVSLSFIHPEAFGTLDASVIEHFGILDIFDLKYGLTYVSPINNLQFIFYALAVAFEYNWNFKRIRMWTLQPRVKGFDGYVFWEITIQELRKYEEVFKRAVDRVEKHPTKYTEGDWCWFCKAKKICPLKTEGRNDKAKNVFQQENERD